MNSDNIPLVAHVIYSLGTGGLENGLVNIINRTPPERYRHLIICLTSAHEFARRITAPDVKVLELNKRDGQDWSMYSRLLRLLRELRPDILHTRNLAALDVQVLGMFFPSMRQVHGEHGRDIYDLDGSNWKYRQLRRAMRLFVDRYIAVSHDLEEWLLNSIKIPPQRVRQIYNGVDSARFKPRQGERPPVLPAELTPPEPFLVIGTVGRLVEVKHQRLILQGVSLLLEKNKAWRQRLRVVLVGDGPLFEDLHREAADLGVEGLVWMPGDREDIPELLQAMDIFVLPSLGEGISNTILEAMAAGLPVIATDVGGNPELVQNGLNGRLVPVGNAGALCNALLELLESEEARSRMSLQALTVVQKRFDWDRAVAEYLELYDELLGRSDERQWSLRPADTPGDMEAE